MTTETSFAHRAIAACGAVALTMSMLVSYFATPAVQTAAAMLA